MKEKINLDIFLREKQEEFLSRVTRFAEYRRFLHQKVPLGFPLLKTKEEWEETWENIILPKE